MKILGISIDERFLTHRQRSTSYAAMVGVAVTGGLFYWRFFHDHVFSWDLFAVIASMALSKIALMIWYRFTD